MRQSIILITIFVSSILFVSPAAMVSDDNNQVIDQFNFPKIGIISVEIVTETPEEDLSIMLEVTVRNNDSFGYNSSNTFINLQALEAAVEGPGPDPIPFNVLNYSISIDAESDETFLIEVSIEGGSFTLTSSIYVGGTLVPTSISVIPISVLGPPIGDVVTLQNYVLGIVGFVLGAVAVPTLGDILRIKKKKNGNKTSQ